MKELLYKEFKLAVNPAFYILLLLPVLILIPSWIYFIAMSYLFFIVIPNVFLMANSNNDTFFSILMPVKKSDLVKSKLMSVIILEILNIAIAVPFAIINFILYKNNFFMDPNIAFFGFVLIMYAIFNLTFIPGYYKTGYKIAFPIIKAIIFAVLFAFLIETMRFVFPDIRSLFDTHNGSIIWQLLILMAGIIIFILSNITAFKLSAKRFEKLDL